MRVVAVLAQVDTRAIELLERIATAQLIMAAVMILILLGLLGLGVMIMLQLRAVRRSVRQAANELKPQLAPLIDRAKSVTDDVAGLTDNVRRKVDDVLHTVEDLRRALEQGGAATEERVRRFGTVLDVVQTEAEELLIDAASTARGVHETARVLQRSRRALRRGRAHEEADDERS